MRRTGKKSRELGDKKRTKNERKERDERDEEGEDEKRREE